MFSLSAFAQTKDTVFLKPKNIEGHSIYIDPSPDSEYYNRIADLSYSIKDKDYNQSIERLNIYKTKAFIDVNLTGIPRNWCPLEIYKGEYYVYSPSESSETRISINDSTKVQQNMERGVYLLEAVSRTTKNSYKIFTIEDYMGRRNSFTIHIIDLERGIAVFENLFYRSKEELFRYILMVDVSKVKNFPLVVNYSPIHRELEFVFDRPNFKELLKNAN